MDIISSILCNHYESQAMEAESRLRKVITNLHEIQHLTRDLSAHEPHPLTTEDMSNHIAQTVSQNLHPEEGISLPESDKHPWNPTPDPTPTPDPNPPSEPHPDPEPEAVSDKLAWFVPLSESTSKSASKASERKQPTSTKASSRSRPNPNPDTKASSRPRPSHRTKPPAGAARVRAPDASDLEPIRHQLGVASMIPLDAAALEEHRHQVKLLAAREQRNASQLRLTHAEAKKAEFVYVSGSGNAVSGEAQDQDQGDQAPSATLIYSTLTPTLGTRIIYKGSPVSVDSTGRPMSRMASLDGSHGSSASRQPANPNPDN